MTKKQITISGTDRMSATPAALLVQTASRFDSKVFIEQKDKLINAKSIMGVMTLRIVDGSVVSVVAEGADEEEAENAVEKLLTGK